MINAGHRIRVTITCADANNTETRARILIVDDEPDMLRMLAFSLSLEGFAVTVAHSGAEAVSATQDGGFDVAVTDLKMPGMSGFETLRALRVLDPDLRIVVATGYATNETAAECRAEGAFDLICKPFDIDELKGLLKRALDDRNKDR